MNDNEARQIARELHRLANTLEVIQRDMRGDVRKILVTLDTIARTLAKK